jgi:uncharacterized OB-fold protein
MSIAQQKTESDDLSILLPGNALAIRAGGAVLLGGHCKSCNASTFPAYPVCPVCMSEEVEAEEMPKTGTVYSLSTVHVGPAKWHKPFTVGYVDLDNGVRLFSHLKGDIRIGDAVRVDMAEVGHADGKPINSFVFGKKDS